MLDFDRMLALTGNTGPYLQYADRADPVDLPPGRASSPRPRPGPIHARRARRAGAGAAAARASAPRCTRTAAAAEPHKLAAFLFEVASAFTTFYEQCPVLQRRGPAVRDSRLALAALTLRVLVTGLGLLGIPVPERM